MVSFVGAGQPVGLNLYILSSILDAPIEEVIRGSVAVLRPASSAAGLRHLRPETLDVAAEVGLRIIGGKE